MCVHAHDCTCRVVCENMYICICVSTYARVNACAFAYCVCIGFVCIGLCVHRFGEFLLSVRLGVYLGTMCIFVRITEPGARLHPTSSSHERSLYYLADRCLATGDSQLERTDRSHPAHASHRGCFTPHPASYQRSAPTQCYSPTQMSIVGIHCFFQER